MLMIYARRRIKFGINDDNFRGILDLMSHGKTM